MLIDADRPAAAAGTAAARHALKTSWSAATRQVITTTSRAETTADRRHSPPN